MPWNTQPDFWSLVGALIVSTISGFISIVQRVTRGQRASLIWVTSEFLAAILCGYLMFDAYPTIQPELPVWATLPIMVALAAHLGGRCFQGIENAVHRKYKLLDRRLPDNEPE